MNCKPGDLAVIVRSRAGNEGRLVTCLRLANKAEADTAGFAQDAGPIWVVDRQLNTLYGFPATLAHDNNLRPIRDPGDDAVDETLLRLPAPSTERETA